MTAYFFRAAARAGGGADTHRNASRSIGDGAGIVAGIWAAECNCFIGEFVNRAVYTADDGADGWRRRRCGDFAGTGGGFGLAGIDDFVWYDCRDVLVRRAALGAGY